MPHSIFHYIPYFCHISKRGANKPESFKKARLPPETPASQRRFQREEEKRGDDRFPHRSIATDADKISKRSAVHVLNDTAQLT